MPSRAKVLYLIERLARAGTEMHLVRLLERLDRTRFEPVLCCLNGAMTDRSLVPEDVRLHLLHGGWNLARPREIRNLWRQVTGVLREERPDILHSSLFVSNVLGAFAGKRLGVQAVVASRGRMGIEWHAGVLHRILQRAANRRVSRILCKTAAMADEIARVEAVERGKLLVIPNGVDVERFSPPPDGRKEARRALAEKAGVPEDGPLAVAVGNLKPIKGHEFLIRALALKPLQEMGVRAAILGTGESADYLDARVKILGLPQRCMLPGSVEDVRPWLAAADVFVAPSLSEGMPNAVLEAMAVGVPMILSDIPGHRETAGDTAWYFQAGAPELLGAALVEALHEPSLCARRAAEGLERVRRDYSLTVMVQRIEEVYESLLADHQQSAFTPA